MGLKLLAGQGGASASKPCVSGTILSHDGRRSESIEATPLACAEEHIGKEFVVKVVG